MCLADSFSPSMLPYKTCVLRIAEIDMQKAKEILNNGFIPAIGQQATVAIISKLFEVPISICRSQIELHKGDMLVIVQVPTEYQTGNIPSKEELENLVKNGDIRFYLMELEPI